MTTFGDWRDAVLVAARIGAVFGVGFLILTPVAGIGIAAWIVARQRTLARKLIAFAILALLVVAAVVAFVLLRPSNQPPEEFPGGAPSVAPEESE